MGIRPRLAGLLALALWINVAGGADEARLQLLASGFQWPLAVRDAGDGSGRRFVIEKAGLIRIIDNNDMLLALPFLNLTALTNTTSSSDERGLLGLAFHPNFPVNGQFYVNYTAASNGRTVIAKYEVSLANPDLADPLSALVLLEIPQPFPNHNGGDIHFGPDGYLYISSGDGGSANDPGQRAQNLGLLLGKMLRIDVDNPGINPAGACAAVSTYGIPADNPFSAVAGSCSEIWAYGLRNPYRFSFDSLTGDMLIADVGQGLWEEVNFQPMASPGGQDYGWDNCEGTHDFEGSGCDSGAGGVLPIIEYQHINSPVRRCSITGGYRFRRPGSVFDGAYFFGDYCSGEIFAARQSGADWSCALLVDPATDNSGYCPGGFCLSGFGEDQSGKLYVTDLGGRVYNMLLDEPIFVSGFESLPACIGGL